ncbi:MAG: Hsp20/alpha crystallin family protein [Dehalococcoidia bacterium]
MVLTRWDPFRDLRRWHGYMDRLARDVYQTPNGEAELEKWAIPLDVVREGDNFIVRASMPGVALEDIRVSIDENVLTIKGETKSEQEHQEGEYLMRERRSGSFHRALRLPDTVDTDQAESHYENGILAVTFPKLEAKKAKQLTVSAGQAAEVEK